MKAIVTKYHGPTNTKGSRITASDEDGNRVTVGLLSNLNHDDNHRRAAVRLMRKMKWTGKLIGGGLANGMVWVFADSTATANVLPMGCDQCGHETIDVRKRPDGDLLCDLCYR